MGLIEAAVFRLSDAVNTSMIAALPYLNRIQRVWQALLLLVIAALLIPVIRPLWSANSAKSTRSWRSDVLLILTFSAALFCALLPSFNKDRLNPDEAFFVAAGNKLLLDPIFYRSVDTGTCGALNIYPLIVPAFLGGNISYVSVRLTGWLLLTATIACLYLTFAFLLDRHLGRLAIFPLFTCVLLFGHPDFLHYSSERVSLFLIAACILLLASVFFDRTRRVQLCLFGVGVGAGAMCCAKLQSVPTAAVLLLAAFGLALAKSNDGFRRWGSLAALALGAVSIPGLLLLTYYRSGVIIDFYRSYIVQNLAYSERIARPLSKKLLWATASPFAMPDLRWYALGLLAFGLVAAIDRILSQLDVRFAKPGWRQFFLSLVVALIVFVYPDPAKSVILVFLLAACIAFLSISGTKRWTLRDWAPYGFACALTSAAIYSIGKPGNHFAHYLLYAIIPIGVCTALALDLVSEVTEDRGSSKRLSRHWLGLFLALVVVLPAFSVVIRRPNIPAGIVEPPHRDIFREPRFSPETSELAKAVRERATERDSLVVWGWQSELYVTSGLVQGTRFGDSIFQLSSPVYRDFFRHVYLSDFQHSRPAVFVDAVGPNAFYYTDRSLYGHETFPELAAIVNSEYELVGEIGPDRIYARRSAERYSKR